MNLSQRIRGVAIVGAIWTNLCIAGAAHQFGRQAAATFRSTEPLFREFHIEE